MRLFIRDKVIWRQKKCFERVICVKQVSTCWRNQRHLYDELLSTEGVATHTPSNHCTCKSTAKNGNIKLLFNHRAYNTLHCLNCKITSFFFLSQFTHQQICERWEKTRGRVGNPWGEHAKLYTDSNPKSGSY